jgi:hypothetical protein
VNVFRPEQGAPLLISIRAPEDGEVMVRVFNLAGENVRTPFRATVQAGLWYQASWDGRNGDGQMISSGVYFISVRGAGIKTLRRVIVLK